MAILSRPRSPPGETPSPELVASAGATQGLARRYSIPCLLLVILCLVGSTSVRERTSALMHADLDYSPEVLAVKSRATAELLGYHRKPGDTALWLEHRGRFLAHMKALPEPHKWDEWLASDAPISSFYREAPRSLNAEPFGYVTRDNPPPIFPGMVQVVLDGQGRLRDFSAAPYGPTEDLEKPVPPEVVFQAADLDMKTFTEITPVAVPFHATDSYRAWRGPHPKIPDTSLVVEIGSWRGRITHAQVAYPWMRAAGAPRPQRSFFDRFRGHLFLFITAVGFVFVALLAHRNWKLGRTDRKGALRIATVKFGLGMIVWAGTVHAVPNEDMLFYFFHNAAEWFTVSAMIWLLYLALEPALRARWPRSIVTWNRILAGRWNDAQVGAHILIGATTGCGLWMIANLLEMWLGDYNLNTDSQLSFTLGTRQWLAGHASTVSVAINISLIAFFCIFGLRLLLRKDILAAIAAAVSVHAEFGPGNLLARLAMEGRHVHRYIRDLDLCVASSGSCGHDGGRYFQQQLRRDHAGWRLENLVRPRRYRDAHVADCDRTHCVLEIARLARFALRIAGYLANSRAPVFHRMSSLTCSSTSRPRILPISVSTLSGRSEPIISLSARDVIQNFQDVMRHKTGEFDVDVRAHVRCNDSFGRIQPTACVSKNDRQFRISSRRRNVERRKRKWRARSCVNNDGKLILQRGLKEEIRTARDRIESVILRLQFQRAKTKFFGTALQLLMKMICPRMKASTARESIRVRPNGRGDLVVRRTLILHDRKRNQERPVDSVSVHVAQHGIHTHRPTTMTRCSKMRVRVEDAVIAFHVGSTRVTM